MSTVGAVKYKQQGMTLIELMVSLSLMVLMLAVLLSSVSGIDRQDQGQQFTKLLNVLELARGYSASHYRRLTLCSVDAAGQCKNSWSNNVSVFFDANNSNGVDQKESILTTISIKNALVMSNRAIIHFAPMATAATTAASIYFCVDNKKANKIVISNVGRIRTELLLPNVKCAKV